jgi:hypothetical protein
MKTIRFLQKTMICIFQNSRLYAAIDTAGGGASATAICCGIYTRSHSLLVNPSYKFFTFFSTCLKRVLYGVYKLTYSAAISATNATTEGYLESMADLHFDTPFR